VKVLLVRFSSAGDILLMARLIAALKRAGHAVHVLTKPGFKQAASAAGASKVLAYGINGLRSLMSAASALSKEGYGAVVDLHGTIRSVLVTALVRAGKKAYYSKKTLARRLMVIFKWFLGGEITPVWQRYFKTTRKALPVEIPGAAAAKKKKAENVVIHTGAKWPLKRWPYFEELALALAKKGLKVTVTGVKDEVENYSGLAYNKIRDIRDLTGKTDFSGLLSVIKKAGLFIGNDTAAAHAALMYGVPAVVIMGPTVQEFGFVTSRDVHVIEKKGMLCRPCHVHGGGRCPINGFYCMKDISAAEAAAQVLKIIRQGRS
jgi:ADP-heptose:LPS heptosyltransferase